MFYIPAQQTTVAFTVAMTTNINIVPGGSTVIWETVIDNTGGAYEVGSGQFICPDDGLYYVIVSSVTGIYYFTVKSLIFLDIKFCVVYHFTVM